MQKRKSHKKHWFLGGIIILSIVAGCAFYVNDYYRALPEALAVVAEPAEGIIVAEEKNDRIVFEPEDAKAGLIFYPGGKVQYEAYAPLMEALITEEYPDIEKWYIGGHSLGGSMAASYAAKNTEELEGVILLASYSTVALQNSGLDVVSIYGSNDRVLNLEKHDKYCDNLPENFKEEVIEGGNHAYFGKYGFQEGDGEATITNENQIETTADIVATEILE